MAHLRRPYRTGAYRRPTLKKPVLSSLPGIADLVRFGDGPARLVIEVPHGADRRSDYDAVRVRLAGEMPADLHTFFHINTDVGAWQLGEAVARAVALRGHSVIAIRSLLPRTFIDCNRLEDATAAAGLTAGLAPWIRHPADRDLLLEAHRQYVGLVSAAIAEVTSNNGYIFLPHTYGPRTMDIPSVGDDIVERLREQVEPKKWASLPLRPEIDLISRTPEGDVAAPEDSENTLVSAYAALGISVAVAQTYTLHPVTLGARWAIQHPGRALCLEVRRDLLVDEWLPFDEMHANPVAVARISAPLTDLFAALLGM